MKEGVLLDFIKCSHGRRGLDRPKSGFAQPSLLPPTSAGRGRVWRDGGRPRSERGKDRGGRADIYLRGWWFPYPFPLLVLYFNLHRSPSLPHFFIQSLSLFRSHYFPFSISLTEYLFIYAACSVAVAAATRSLLFARHLMDIFVSLSLSLSLSLQINNIVTA